MKVTTIVVTAGRTFNHPFESYSNLRPEVSITATVEEGEGPDDAVRKLQARAEQLVEDHKANMLRSIEELQNLSVARQEIQGLQQTITRGQQRLDLLRKQHPELGLITAGENQEAAPI